MLEFHSDITIYSSTCSSNGGGIQYTRHDGTETILNLGKVNTISYMQ